MKKTRKFLALMMVLAIMLSVLVLPASAADVDPESVDPCAVTAFCPDCGGEVITNTSTVKGDIKQEWSCTADNSPMMHKHREITFTYHSLCSDCDWQSTTTAVKKYCEDLKKYI